MGWIYRHKTADNFMKQTFNRLYVFGKKDFQSQ